MREVDILRTLTAKKLNLVAPDALGKYVIYPFRSNRCPGPLAGGGYVPLIVFHCTTVGDCRSSVQPICRTGQILEGRGVCVADVDSGREMPKLYITMTLGKTLYRVRWLL